MDLVVFLPPTTDPEPSAGLLPMIQRQWRVGEVEHHATLESLADRLGRPRPENFYLLLWPPNGVYLDRLVAMRDLMAGLPTVCVLPDSLSESLVKGHLLHPRLLIAREEANAIIAEVLRNFQNRVKSPGHSQ